MTGLAGIRLLSGNHLHSGGHTQGWRGCHEGATAPETRVQLRVLGEFGRGSENIWFIIYLLIQVEIANSSS